MGCWGGVYDNAAVCAHYHKFVAGLSALIAGNQVFGIDNFVKGAAGDRGAWGLWTWWQSNR